MTKAPLPPIGLPAMDGNEIGEELLPLGVPSNANKRRLLQLRPKQGPRLPPDEELRRLKLHSDAGMPAEDGNNNNHNNNGNLARPTSAEPKALTKLKPTLLTQEKTTTITIFTIINTINDNVNLYTITHTLL